MAGAHAHLHTHTTRRTFLKGLGMAAAGAATTAIGPAAPAFAAAGSGRKTFPSRPGPKPITPVIDVAAPPDFVPDDPFRFIHWLLPGPAGSTTPFNQLPGFGLDVDPATIGDYEGFTAFAVISGHATDHDGNPYDVEFDVRAMRGTYIGADGEPHHGTFGFF